MSDMTKSRENKHMMAAESVIHKKFPDSLRTRYKYINEYDGRMQDKGANILRGHRYHQSESKQKRSTICASTPIDGADGS